MTATKQNAHIRLHRIGENITMLVWLITIYDWLKFVRFHCCQLNARSTKNIRKSNWNNSSCNKIKYKTTVISYQNEQINTNKNLWKLAMQIRSILLLYYDRMKSQKIKITMLKQNNKVNQAKIKKHYKWLYMTANCLF
jgi:hypothetical protein